MLENHVAAFPSTLLLLTLWNLKFEQAIFLLQVWDNLHKRLRRPDREIKPLPTVWFGFQS
ncbi:hypothetical protein HanPSC8_Chr09g0398831 [Helianthus annuus]|nr:hypothetical protein HanPSC8_Chr09g0398831 [Helianthus annuus]